MSLLFDQNLSYRLPRLLVAEFPGAEQTSLIGLEKADDLTIWTYAASHRLAIVSKDTDFLQLSARLGPPPQVIWLRVGNRPTRDIEWLLRSMREDIWAFLNSPGVKILELP